MNINQIIKEIEYHNKRIDEMRELYNNEKRYVKESVKKFYMQSFNNHPKHNLINKYFYEHHKYITGSNGLKKQNELFNKLLDLGIKNLTDYKIITNIQFSKRGLWVNQEGNISISKDGLELIPINGYSTYKFTKYHKKMQLIKKHGKDIILYLDGDNEKEIMNILIKYCNKYKDVNIKRRIIDTSNDVTKYTINASGKSKLHVLKTESFQIDKISHPNIDIRYYINFDGDVGKWSIYNHNPHIYKLYAVSVIWNDIEDDVLEFMEDIKTIHKQRQSILNDFRNEISPYVLAGEL